VMNCLSWCSILVLFFIIEAKGALLPEAATETAANK